MALELIFEPIAPTPREDPFLVRERLAHLEALLPEVRDIAALAPSTPAWAAAMADLERGLTAWPLVCEGALAEQGIVVRAEQLEALLMQRPTPLPQAWLPVLAQWAEACEVLRMWREIAGTGLAPAGRVRELQRRLQERAGQLRERGRGVAWRWWGRATYRVAPDGGPSRK